jgi:hypothetical protein
MCNLSVNKSNHPIKNPSFLWREHPTPHNRYFLCGPCRGHIRRAVRRTPKNIQAGVPQGSVLSPTLYSLYINDTPQTPGVLFADDTCIYAADRKECYVLRKLQRGLSAIETWCER